MFALFVLVALTIASSNAGFIGAPLGAPLATSIVGARTISLAAPAAYAAPLPLASPLLSKSIIAAPALGSPLGLSLGAPLLGKSIVAGPALASPLGLSLGAPLLSKSYVAAPAIAPWTVGSPLLKAW